MRGGGGRAGSEEPGFAGPPPPVPVFHLYAEQREAGPRPSVGLLGSPAVSRGSTSRQRRRQRRREVGGWVGGNFVEARQFCGCFSESKSKLGSKKPNQQKKVAPSQRRRAPWLLLRRRRRREGSGEPRALPRGTRGR